MTGTHAVPGLSAPLSFLGAPHATGVPAGARAFIAGLPLDAGQHAVRVGSRLGPRSVREQSALLRPVDPDSDTDVLAALGLVDLGDVRIPHGDIEAAQHAIFEAARAWLASTAVPVTIGGDGTVTLPLLRALAERHPGLAVVHLDAHTDAYPLPGHAGPTAFHHAATSNLVDPRSSFHIGLRGPVALKGLYPHARELGYQLVTMEQLLERGIPEVIGEVRRRLEGRPVFVCWDMDFFDPSIAPGAFTPSWGGATVREGLQIAKLLGSLDLVALDINTVSPLHDAAGTTAFLCARVIFEFLSALARRSTSTSGSSP